MKTSMCTYIHIYTYVFIGTHSYMYACIYMYPNAVCSRQVRAYSLFGNHIATQGLSSCNLAGSSSRCVAPEVLKETCICEKRLTKETYTCE